MEGCSGAHVPLPEAETFLLQGPRSSLKYLPCTLRQLECLLTPPLQPSQQHSSQQSPSVLGRSTWLGTSSLEGAQRWPGAQLQGGTGMGQWALNAEPHPEVVGAGNQPCPSRKKRKLGTGVRGSSATAVGHGPVPAWVPPHRLQARGLSGV